jgi:hypothetical protein
MEHKLPVAVVCRVLGAPRSSIYARRGSAGAGGRPGPATSMSDADLVELIRRVLEDSPFAGEGDRTVRAWLGREHGVHVSGKRVLRLLRAHGLLAPHGSVAGARHGSMTAGSSLTVPTCAGAPTPPWPGPGSTAGCGCLCAWTTSPPRPGPMWPRSATASPPSSRSTTWSSTAGAGWTPTSLAAFSCGTTGAAIPLGPLHRLPGLAGHQRRPGVPGGARDQRLR